MVRSPWVVDRGPMHGLRSAVCGLRDKSGEMDLAAPALRTLGQLPSNRLESLSGDRAGQFSIRINEQWRICFEWPEDTDEPFNIEIVDYH